MLNGKNFNVYFHWTPRMAMISLILPKQETGECPPGKAKQIHTCTPHVYAHTQDL